MTDDLDNLKRIVQYIRECREELERYLSAAELIERERKEEENEK